MSRGRRGLSAASTDQGERVPLQRGLKPNFLRWKMGTGAAVLVISSVSQRAVWWGLVLTASLYADEEIGAQCRGLVSLRDPQRGTRGDAGLWVGRKLPPKVACIGQGGGVADVGHGRYWGQQEETQREKCR